MIDSTMLAKAQVLLAFFDVIAKCRDLGIVPATDPRLGIAPQCDMCGCQPPSAHLLQGAHGFAWTLTPDDPRNPIHCSVYSLDRGEERDAQYWVCARCLELLRKDKLALLKAILEP
jgi:hypothetical protein